MDKFEQFRRVIVESSEADNYDEAIKEWVQDEVQTYKPNCICGQDIIHCFPIRNVLNETQLVVGSECIEKLESAELVEALHETRINRARAARGLGPRLRCEHCRNGINKPAEGQTMHKKCQAEVDEQKRLEEVRARFRKLREERMAKELELEMAAEPAVNENVVGTERKAMREVDDPLLKKAKIVWGAINHAKLNGKESEFVYSVCRQVIRGKKLSDKQMSWLTAIHKKYPSVRGAPVPPFRPPAAKAVPEPVWR